MAAELKSEIERQYPHIVDKLVLMWGYPELNHYLDKLLFADRKRDGFPPEVMEELMLLHALNASATSNDGVSLV